MEKTILLNNGVKMPRLGLGVFKAKEGKETYDAVYHALKVGYRAIDTASYYQNEKSVGQAIKDSGIPREELFITTKIWNDQQGYTRTFDAFKQSLNQLQLDYIDLYLIHWPVKQSYIQTWQAMEELYKQKKIRAIGVSNFHLHHIEQLLKHATILPAVDQIELHPTFSQEALQKGLKEKTIATEAWSPLGRGEDLKHPVITAMAQKYHKTPAQIIIRWHIQKDIIVIPKSIHETRIEENSDVFDFSLTPEEMNRLGKINSNHRLFRNPDEYDER